MSGELTSQKCNYPSDIRLPRPNKRYFLECTPAHLYEEKECPADTEFNIALRNCTAKSDTIALPQPASESSGDDGMAKSSRGFGNKQSNQQLQWPFYPIELHSSCTSDGWCPHDPAKLQFCDVNGEQFMQCSNMGWILKICPPGSLFAGHLGRCVDPRESANVYPQTSQETLPKTVNSINSGNFPDSTNDNNLQQLNFNVKPIPSVPNSNLPQVGQLPQIGSQYQLNGFPSQQLQPNMNSQPSQIAPQYLPQPSWNLIQPQQFSGNQPWNQQQQQQQQVLFQQQATFAQPWSQPMPQQQNSWPHVQQPMQSNNGQSSWNNVQQPPVLPVQSNNGQMSWPQNQEQPVLAAQPNNGQSSWVSIQPTNTQGQQQLWNQNQSQSQFATNGQTVPLTPSEAASLPRGQLVWTTAKQPTSSQSQSQQQISLGSLVVDSDKLHEPWSATDYPSFIVQQNPSDPSQGSAPGYQSWSVPASSNPNIDPVNNNIITDNSMNQQGSMNNNYVQSNSNQNGFVHATSSNKVQPNFSQHSSIQPVYQPSVQPAYQSAYQPVYQPAVQPSYQPAGQSPYQPTNVNKAAFTGYYPTWNNSAPSWNQELYQSQGENNPYANYRLYLQSGGNLIPIQPSQLLMNPYYAANLQSQYPYYAYGYGYGLNGGTTMAQNNNWINSYQQFPTVPNYASQPYQQPSVTSSQSQIGQQQQTVPQTWTVNQLQSQAYSQNQQNQIRYPQNQFGHQTNMIGGQADSMSQNVGNQNNNNKFSYPYVSNKQTSKQTSRAQKGRKVIPLESRRNCSVS